MGHIFLRLALVPFSILLFFVELRDQPNRVLQGSALQVVDSSGRWEKAAPLPSYRHESASGVIGEDIYVVGGIMLPSVWFPTKTVEAYNAKTDSWRTVAAYPLAVHHTGAAVIDGKLYVVGGNGVRITVRSDVYMYDPEKNIWERKADLPIARGALGVASLDGRLYAVGGGINKKPVNFLHIYDPRTDTWKEGTSMPTAREHLTAVAAEGKIFTLGGYAGIRFNNVTSNESYDPATDTWEKRAPIPYPVSGFTAVVLGNSIFIFGGEQGWAVSNEVHEYIISEDRWVRRSDLPVGRYALVSGIVEGNIHVIGGNPYLMGNYFSSDHDVYIP